MDSGLQEIWRQAGMLMIQLWIVCSTILIWIFQAVISFEFVEETAPSFNGLSINFDETPTKNRWQNITNYFLHSICESDIFCRKFFFILICKYCVEILRSNSCSMLLHQSQLPQMCHSSLPYLGSMGNQGLHQWPLGQMVCIPSPSFTDCVRCTNNSSAHTYPHHILEQ